MLDAKSDFQTMTSFKRKSGSILKQLEKSKRPVTLTVRGKATAVVQDAESYQRLLDVAADASPAEGIRQGLEDAMYGRTRPAEEFFDEFEAAHGISR